jgi:hypothetical protein
MADMAKCLNDTNALVLVTCGGAIPKGKKVPEGGLFLVAGPVDLVAKAGPEVATLLGGKGGGGKGKFQGKAADLTEEAREKAKAVLVQQRAA